MGNWHCVPNGCARVVYREYLPPGIRYRYPGEDWQYVDADDYSVNTDIVCQGENIYPRVFVQAVGRQFGGALALDGLLHGIPGNTNSVYSDLSVDSEEITINFINNDGAANSVKILASASEYNAYPGFHWVSARLERIEYVLVFYRPDGSVKQQFKIDTSTSIPNRYCSSQCEFIIYKNGEIVHQETRSECPEVEQESECKLSDTYKQIKVKKLSYLERVEVVPYSYNAFKQPGLGVPAPIVQIEDIPPECLHIYNNFVGVLIPDEDALENPNATPFDSLIKQICSAPGCPPPEYTVYCDCDCEKCPDGTCAIVCDDHVCCNDKVTGKFVQQIPLENYCWEGN